MHHGVFVGENAPYREKRILILGESHRISTEDVLNKELGKPATYTTESVVNDYISIGSRNKTSRSYRFFSNIANSFSFPTNTVEERKNFWERVYFGNYADVLGGVGDDFIKGYIFDNRTMLNDSLFAFVNHMQIDLIFCFSKRVYKKLPSLSDGECESIHEITSSRSDLKKTVYMPNQEHANSCVKLYKELTVYGLQHASSYFSSTAYKDYFSSLQLF